MNIINLKRQASASVPFTPFVILGISAESCSGKQTDGLGRLLLSVAQSFGLSSSYMPNITVSFGNL